MSGIVWLSSYPKSGNTWIRVFLSNLLENDEKPVNINKLSVNLLSADRDLLEEVLGIESHDLTLDEIDTLRLEEYQFLATYSQETLYIKTHDAYVVLPDGRPMFPPKISKAIYIIRNPLNIAISFSAHLGKSIDEIIAFMGYDGAFLGSSSIQRYQSLHQRLSSWSAHVESWLDAPGHDIHVIRYEDMKQRPLETFTAAAHFAGLPYSEDRIRQAIKFSDFSLLKEQEEKEGFHSINHVEGSFFRKGQAGGWRNVLTPAQAEQIIHDHSRVMRRCRYLEANGEVVF